MDNWQFKEINIKLDRIIKLLAANAIQEKNFREQIKLLTDVGFGPSEISIIINKDVGTIKTTKTLMKKKNGQR